MLDRDDYEWHQRELLDQRWRVDQCSDSQCWCACVVAENAPEVQDLDMKYVVIASGSVSKAFAERIVADHNRSLLTENA